MKKIRIPSYRLHKPTGQAVVTLSGRDHYLGRYESPESRQRYLRLITEWEATGRASSFGEPVESLTMAQVALDYLDHARASYGPDSTEYDLMKRSLQPVSELYATYPARQFGPAEFKACRQWWFNKPDRTRQHINKMAAKLLRVIKWAASEGKLPADAYRACECVEPLRAGRTTAVEAPKVGTVSDERIEQVLPFLSPIVADMVRLQRLTGARPSEVCNLKPSMIERTGEVWKAVLQEHKTAHRGKTRKIFIGPKAQAIIAKYLLRDADSFCFSPKESVEWHMRQKAEKRVTPPNCGNKPGSNCKRKPSRQPSDSYDAKSYAKAVSRACEQAYPTPKGLEGRARLLWRKANWFAPNQLRHNRATEIRERHGIEHASAALGHNSLGITLTYAEQAERLAKQAALMTG